MVGNECFECTARGVFRKDDISPLVGDMVEISVDGNQKGLITTVLKRKNWFLRPAIANLDKLFLVISTCQPNPSPIVIDKLIAVCEYKDIEPIIVITKTDLKSEEHLYELYNKSGFKTIALSNLEEQNFDQIKAELRSSISAFAGNTGVGKSSLMNNIYPNLQLETADISKKLGRGKHTTRHVELYKVDEADGYVADTPGFGAMELGRYEIIYKDKLEFCFREFAPFLNKCKYTGCSHTVEKGCAVLEGLAQGAIQQARFDSYVEMYNDAKTLNEWER